MASMVDRLAQETCKEVRSLITPYNTVAGVPPVTGILFTITATKGVELLTFELGVVTNTSSAVDDLTVEVYSMKGEFFHLGDYLSYQNDEKLWTPLFQSNGTLDPQGAGMLLSMEEFMPIFLGAGDTFSFYITMKRPYLNCVAQALQKTGEVQADGEDFAVTVGAGLSEYKFPESINPIVDPQFSGRIYYRTKSDCFTTTTVQFPFIFSQDLPIDDEIGPVVDQAMSEFLLKSAALKELSTSRWLEMAVPSEAKRDLYNGQCPNAWSKCPRVVFRATISVRHHETIDPSWLSVELYMADELLTTFLQNSLLRRGGYNDVELAYIGYKSIEAGFNLNLTASSKDYEAGAVDHEYIARVMASFLTATIDSKLASNFYVDALTLSRTGGLGQTVDGEIQRFGGQVRGTRFGYLGFEEFSETLQEAFQNEEDLFLVLAATQVLTPGEASSSFQRNTSPSFQNMSIVIDPATGFSEPVLSAASGSNQTTTIVASVMSVVLVLLALIVIYFLRRRVLNHKSERDNVVPADLRIDAEPESNVNPGQLSRLVSRFQRQKERHVVAQSAAATSARPEAQTSKTTKRPPRQLLKKSMDRPGPPSNRNLVNSEQAIASSAAMPGAADGVKSLQRVDSPPPSPRSANGRPVAPNRSPGAARPRPPPRTISSASADSLTSSPRPRPPPRTVSSASAASSASAPRPRPPPRTVSSTSATSAASAQRPRPPPRTVSSHSAASSASSPRSPPPTAKAVVPGVPSRWLPSH